MTPEEEDAHRREHIATFARKCAKAGISAEDVISFIEAIVVEGLTVVTDKDQGFIYKVKGAN